MNFTVAEQLASSVAAYLNCRDGKTINHEWERRHRERVEQIVKQFMPSGSGWDCGTKLDFDRSTGEKLVFTGSYHHMNEGGFYDGWTDHTVTVRPSLLFGFIIVISGRNRNDIKEYLHDIFHYALSQRIVHQVTKEGDDRYVLARPDGMDLPTFETLMQVALNSSETGRHLVETARLTYQSSVRGGELEGVNANLKEAMTRIAVQRDDATRLLGRIADALATAESGENLVSVARDANEAERRFAAIQRDIAELQETADDEIICTEASEHLIVVSKAALNKVCQAAEWATPGGLEGERTAQQVLKDLREKWYIHTQAMPESYLSKLPPGDPLLDIDGILTGDVCRDAIGAAEKYIIRSDSEHGYWSDEQGWVFDVASATKFDDRSFSLPISRGGDSRWVKTSTAKDFDPNEAGHG